LLNSLWLCNFATEQSLAVELWTLERREMSKKKPPLTARHPVDAMERFDRLLKRMAPKKGPLQEIAPPRQMPRRGQKAIVTKKPVF
jgi:hypothetical protein